MAEIVKYTPIIPVEQIFYNSNTRSLINWESSEHFQLDLKAIATFCALGYMLDDETFYTGIKTCKPATKYELDENSKIINEEQYWHWHYNPKDKTLLENIEEFSDLFEKLVNSKTKNKSILLPISGGLDSRTLFVPLKNRKNLTLVSYEFENGFPESEAGLELSKRFHIPLYAQKIQKGYLWNKLEEFYDLNNCFTDFTHPRQVDVINKWQGLADMIVLGHWGDVLFDKQAVSDDLSYDEQLIQLKKKVLKSGGIELADDLWKFWDLGDSFEFYISDRIDKLYSSINIDHPSARMRAFKSLYWAPRWTSINLSIFKLAGEIILPYYSDEMCKFICTVPERYLEGRRIQIEYIKKYCPEAARIHWQKFYPMNLYQYKRFDYPHYYFIRAIRKTKRILQKYLLKSPEFIIRNWELQFIGDQNFIQLQKNLLERSKFNKLIPQDIIRKYLNNFQKYPVKYAHAVSMLLTLAVFSDKHYSK